MFAFQRLNPRHFVITDPFFPFLGQFWRLLIDRIDITHFFIKPFVIPWGQPIADLMGLYVRFFLKDVPRVGLKSFLLSLASLSHPLFPGGSSG